MSPPGDYGETYFLTQAEVWHRGYQTLSQVTSALLDAQTEWQQSRIKTTRRDAMLYRKIDTAILALMRFHTISGESGVIITIVKGTLKISYIPRDVHPQIQSLLTRWDTHILYGIHIDGPKVSKFLENEAGIEVNNIEQELSPKRGDGIVVDAGAITQLKKAGNIG